MLSARYYDKITELLDFFSVRVQHRNKMNLNDINIHAEYFFMHFLNRLYGWALVNSNNLAKNTPGVDLRYDGGLIVIQVTSTVTHKKVQHSLDMLDTTVYKGYNFKFLSIAKDADNIQNKNYSVPSGIFFNPKSDIVDIKRIYSDLLALHIDIQRELYELTVKYMSIETSNEKRVKGLGRIIEILSGSQYLKDENLTLERKEFEIIEKIHKNGLADLQDKILELSVYQPDVDKVYGTFDAEGINKSIAVLHAINRVYLNLKNTYYGQSLFEAIADSIYDGLKGEQNLCEYNEEDIRYYVDIILIDAFVRCKIFENPKNIK